MSEPYRDEVARIVDDVVNELRLTNSQEDRLRMAEERCIKLAKSTASYRTSLQALAISIPLFVAFIIFFVAEDAPGFAMTTGGILLLCVCLWVFLLVKGRGQAVELKRSEFKREQILREMTTGDRPVDAAPADPARLTTAQINNLHVYVTVSRRRRFPWTKQEEVEVVVTKPGFSSKSESAREVRNEEADSEVSSNTESAPDAGNEQLKP